MKLLQMRNKRLSISKFRIDITIQIESGLESMALFICNIIIAIIC